jgi:nitrogen fixation-related uncharacterized protein
MQDILEEWPVFTGLVLLAVAVACYSVGVVVGYWLGRNKQFALLDEEKKEEDWRL